MTKISSFGSIAVWNNDKGEWDSSSRVFTQILNSYHEEHAPPEGADPFPPGTAVDLAKKHISGLKVIEMDKAPKMEKGVVY